MVCPESRRCKCGVGALKNKRLDGRPDFLKVGPILPCPSQNTCCNYAARNADLARLVAPAIMGYNAHPHAFEPQLDQVPVFHKSRVTQKIDEVNGDCEVAGNGPYRARPTGGNKPRKWPKAVPH